MLTDFLSYLDDPAAAWEGEGLKYKGKIIPVREGAPRFVEHASYSEGNFSKLRERHAAMQMDSQNATTDRYQTILERTGWPEDFFKGKTILECGAGAGPDTEILIKLGARVVACDLHIEAARANLPENESLSLVQASILDLPFRKKAFDIVWCHRVIQHTPNPEATLNHILQFVKDDGAVFVHSYARTAVQMLRWKYALRPFTKNMDPEKLYNMIKGYAPFAFQFTNMMRKIPGGRYFNFFFVPFLNYRHVPKYAPLSDAEMIEYGVHDTFDALSPAFDSPISAGTLEKYARQYLKKPFEIERQPTITLLRTKV